MSRTRHHRHSRRLLATRLARVVRPAAACFGLFLAAAFVAPPAWGQSNPLSIALSGTTTVLPFREFSTRELADPWDMSQRTDLGWFTWGVDSPPSNLSSIGIGSDAAGNTFFRGQAVVLPGNYSDPSFFLLDTAVPGTARLGKIGANHPIDTTLYNALYVRMKVANQVLTQMPVAQVFWSRDTIYFDAQHPQGGTILAQDAQNRQVGVFLTPADREPFGRIEGGTWVVYRIPLTIAGMQAVNPEVHHWQNVSGGATASWGASGVRADSLRVSPFNILGSLVGEFQVDWARLVSESAGTPTTITWSGGGTYDVVVSTRSDCGDFSVVAYGQASGYQLKTQVLPPGTYRVGLRKRFLRAGHTAPAPTTLDSCSTSTFTVRSYPSLTLTSPNPEGSTDDFAATVLGNAWDFDALTDIDFSRNVNHPAGYGIVSRTATDAAGNDLGSVRVYRNVSTATPLTPPGVPREVGDPHIYPLWPIPAPPAPPGTRARGQHNRIDATRYRILTAEVGVERRRDLVNGSIARIIWHVDGELRPSGDIAEIESSDIVLRHLDPASQNGGKLVLDTIQIDMADRVAFPVESDTPQPGSGWSNTCAPSATTTCNTNIPYYSPGINLFRWDFHEFSDAIGSYVKRIKLAALERTGSSFTVRWAAANPSSLGSTVTLKAVPVANPAAANYAPRDPGCSTSASVTIASGISLAAGSYAWSPGSTAGITPGSEYYVCAQVFVSGVSGAIDETMSRWPVLVQAASATPMTASPTSLRFAATKAGPSGAVTAVTSAQPVTVTSGAGWTASSSVPWLQVTSGAGSGAGQFSVAIVNPNNVIGGSTSLAGTITITPTTVGWAPTSVAVTLTVDQTGGATTAPPFGLVDTPLQGVSVVGTIGVTGWVLDDVGVGGVKIYRNCLPFEPQTNCVWVHGANVVFVGDATLVAGARTDIEALYPTYPQNNRAAWGYLLLTNLLPHLPRQQMFGGQGTITLHALATDAEGRQAWLGRQQHDTTPTTVTMTNDTIALPFGAIDTPAQGQTVSGTVVNFGWALTPDANTAAGSGDILVPVNGSTIRVYIDGVPGPAISYNQCRGQTVSGPMPAGVYCDDDVANIFGNVTPQPTFTPRQSNPTKHRNLDIGRGAIGAYVLDTTALANGVHTIVWGVTDSAGRGEGIGSRYFTVLNSALAGRTSTTARAGTAEAAAGVLAASGGAVSKAARGDASSALAAGAAAGLSMLPPHQLVAELEMAPARVRGDASELDMLAVSEEAVPARTGYSETVPYQALDADRAGLRHVALPEFGRLELQLGPVEAGYLLANGTLRDLPPGSQLDAATGRFTWTPGLGYYGSYRLAFVRGGEQLRFDVRVQPVQRAQAGESEVRMQIDTPRHGETLDRRVMVAGWALDPRSSIGSGISAVHVWAERVDAPGSAPVFLGVAALGGERPDVAAQFGALFDRTGFSLTSAELAPGLYDVTAYAWNSRTERWEDARTVRVAVR